MVKQAVDPIDLCGGDLVLAVADGQTYLYMVAPAPASLERNRKPISVPGHYRKWEPAQWALLKELGSMFKDCYPDIDEEIERAMQEVEKNTSRISKIAIKTGKQVFGDAAGSPDRPIAVVWAENGARLVLTVPFGAKYGDGKWSVFGPKAFARSINHERSNFGAFFRRYQEFPHVGLVVETAVDGRGYLTIKC